MTHNKILYWSKLGVLRGSVVNCLTHNQGVLGMSSTGSSGFFMGVSLGKTIQSPSQVLVKPRKDMNNVSCRCDMTEILLKSGVKHHSIYWSKLKASACHKMNVTKDLKFVFRQYFQKVIKTRDFVVWS